MARRGLATSSPAQFGQTCSIASPQGLQNVRSKLQITASPAAASRALQRSHVERISSIASSGDGAVDVDGPPAAETI